MNDTEDKCVLNVRIPRSLASRKNELVRGFGYGCHQIVVGEKPSIVPADKTVAARITLEGRDVVMWEKALARMPGANNSQMVTTVLALVDELKAGNARI